jgi:epoxyqueuosine reductase
MNDLTQQNRNPVDPIELAVAIRGWGVELGFQSVGISDVNLQDAEPRLLEWLGAGFHGDMDYMAKHGAKRARPAELVPGTMRLSTVELFAGRRG